MFNNTPESVVISSRIRVARNIAGHNFTQNYDEDLLRVEQGTERGSVLVEDYIQPVSVMDKLYSIIYII